MKFPTLRIEAEGWTALRGTITDDLLGHVPDTFLFLGIPRVGKQCRTIE